jgi:acyl-CoA synthetase (NDP forming)/GNAT superfamily N-acetyltransferase
VERPYPAHWEADVVLRDGGTAHLRPIRPQDADLLRAFHSRLSAETIYFRFFAPYPELSERDVERFTDVDHVDRVALIATVGDDMIGVVRYERTTKTEAEVAFSIEDAHQGRGLGSVLLEHLAAAARERGIDRFVADVLPANHKMLHVFQDAGYNVTHDFAEGVVHLEFAIAPTDTSLAVMQAREHRAEARSIERLLRPESVAVVGASRDEMSVGHTVLAHLIEAGFTGPVHAVNPGATEVGGVPAYPSVVDVPGPVDLVVVAVRADAVDRVVADCARKGVSGLVVLSAGFGETGSDGRDRQLRLVRAARANGMRVIGPNSFGIINTAADISLNASMSPTMPPRGQVGFFSQSGALGIALLENVAARGLGLSTFVSAGNRADVSGNDLLQYWEEDSDTVAVLLYLESIGNPRKFSRLARRVSRVKPVLAVKAGRFTQGVPLGHPVRPSHAPAAALDAMFRQAGVIQVEDIHRLFDAAQVLAHQPLPAGDRVAILSNSTALTLLTADACAESHLTLAKEPVTLAAEAVAEEFDAALVSLLADPGVDSVVAVFIPPMLTRDEDVAHTVAVRAAESGKTVVASFHGMRGITEQLREVGGSSGAVPAYPMPEAAVRALAHATRYAEWRRRAPGTAPELTGIDRAGARALVESALRATPDGCELSGEELAALLHCYAIELWPSEAVRDVEGAVRAAERLGYPAVLKTTLWHLRHRPDLGDVRLNLEDERQVRAAYAGMAAQLGPVAADALVVQRMAPMGMPCVVGSMEDPLFGPIVSFGVGGLATELLGDRSYRIPPLTDVEAAEMVREPAAAPTLVGYHGADPVDLEALEGLLLRVSRLADDVPELAELELNPVLAAPGGLAVLYATARLAPPARRTDPAARQLLG